MDVDEERLRSDIETNATFGTIKTDGGHGRTVFTGTTSNRHAREHFVDELERAGLNVRIDAVGNIAGRWSPPSAEKTPIAAGSHLDSVPEGGIFDGPLGVYAALEAVRTMQEEGIDPIHPIEVVCFTEEEGQRFAEGMLGSSVAAGDRSIEAALALTDETGTTLETALTEIGFQGDGRINAGKWDTWLELHIEQGDRLETADIPVGIVTAITGITHCQVVVTGEANHAGTTSMIARTDSLSAASEFILDLEAAARETATKDDVAVGTVGNLDIEPNATNVIPGRVEMSLDIRSVTYDSMNTIVDRAQESLSRLTEERGVETQFERGFDLQPTSMSNHCREVVSEACDAAEIETRAMHSGAAHDTMHVANVTDAGLLFAPSCDGISHSPYEWTNWNDCSTATQALAEALAVLAVES